MKEQMDYYRSCCHIQRYHQHIFGFLGISSSARDHSWISSLTHKASGLGNQKFAFAAHLIVDIWPCHCWCQFWNSFHLAQRYLSNFLCLKHQWCSSSNLLTSTGCSWWSKLHLHRAVNRSDMFFLEHKILFSDLDRFHSSWRKGWSQDI